MTFLFLFSPCPLVLGSSGFWEDCLALQTGMVALFALTLKVLKNKEHTSNLFAH